MVGDMVRVRLKRKSFDKGYKPKFSKQIYKVDKVEGNFYIINGLNRKYLRAYIEKVGDIEKNVDPPHLDGTIEGNLKNLSKNPINEETLKEKVLLEQERALNPVALRTRKKHKSIPPPKPKIIESSIPVPKDYTADIASLIDSLFPNLQ